MTKWARFFVGEYEGAGWVFGARLIDPGQQRGIVSEVLGCRAERVTLGDPKGVGAPRPPRGVRLRISQPRTSA